MFDFKSTRKQLLEERRKNAQLTANLNRTTADVAYLAMMTDVEIEDDNADFSMGNEVEREV